MKPPKKVIIKFGIFKVEDNSKNDNPEVSIVEEEEDDESKQTEDEGSKYNPRV